MAGRVAKATRLVAIAGALAFALYLLAFGTRLFDPAIGPLQTSEPWWRIGHVAAGALLLASGIAGLVVPALWRAGALAAAAAVAWFGPDLARFDVAPVTVRAAGIAAALLLLPLLLHLLTAAVSSRSGRAPVHGSVQLVIDALAVGVAAMVLLTYAPFYDVQCVEACAFPNSVLAIDASQRGLTRDATGAVTILAGSVLTLVSMRSAISDGMVSGWLRAVALGASVAGLAGAAVGLVWLEPALQAVDMASIDAAWLVLPALSVGIAAMAGALMWRAADLGLAPRRIRRLADALALHPDGGGLDVWLATVLNDTELRVAYLTDAGRTLAADGEEIELGAIAGRTVTPLSREGDVIALVRHASDVSADTLRRAFRPSMLLALDYERLRAIRLSTLRELQASRARIVELGDAERRRVERDLHDGAQQRLLAIAFDLRLASATARRDGRVEVSALMADAAVRALALVDELRRLCRGIHPQVLSQAGLSAALAGLADESQIPVEANVSLDDRPPMSVETAAYELVVDALAQGVTRGASALSVRVSREAEQIVVVAEDGSPGEPEVRTRLADRIGAVGGALSAGVTEQGGYLRAVLPCA
jgi:signal transduction histidine kinase